MSLLSSKESSSSTVTFYHYTDKEVFEYFNTEKKSGCFLFRDREDKDKKYEEKLLRYVNENASKSVALSRIGVDSSMVEEIPPLCFKGYESEDGYVGRYGKDGKWRTSQYSVTWMFFGDDELYIFYVFMDILHHEISYSTQEYFYKDITSFYTINNSYDYEKKIPKKGCAGLFGGVDTEMKTVKTNKFLLKVPGDNFSCSISGVADMDSIILGFKQKIREKKA